MYLTKCEYWYPPPHLNLLSAHSFPSPSNVSALRTVTIYTTLPPLNPSRILHTCYPKQSTQLLIFLGMWYYIMDRACLVETRNLRFQSHPLQQDDWKIYIHIYLNYLNLSFSICEIGMVIYYGDLFMFVCLFLKRIQSSNICQVFSTVSDTKQ